MKTAVNGSMPRIIVHTDACECPTCGSTVSPEVYAAIIGEIAARDAEIERAAESRFATREAIIRQEATAAANAAAAGKIAKAETSRKTAEQAVKAAKAEFETALRDRLEAQQEAAAKARDEAISAVTVKHFWVIVPVPKIIDEDLFREVQRLMQARDPRRVSERTPPRPTLLSSLARCGTCGGGMALMSGKSGRFRYYKCKSALINRDGGCKDPRVIREAVLDGLVVDHLAGILLEPRRLRKLINEAVEAEKVEQDDAPQQLDKLIRRQSNVESAVSRMHLAIERGLVDFDDTKFADRIRSLQEESAQIKAQIGALKDAANAFPPITADGVREFSAALRSALRFGEARARRAYLRFFLDRVVVNQQEIRLVGHKGLLARAYANDWQAAAIDRSNLRRNSVPPQVDVWWS